MLHKQGNQIAEKTVVNYMRQMGIKAQWLKPHIANWIIKSTDVYLSLIYDRLREMIYDSKVVYADESSVKVMQIDHAKIKNGKKT